MRNIKCLIKVDGRAFHATSSKRRAKGLVFYLMSFDSYAGATLACYKEKSFYVYHIMRDSWVNS